MLKLKYNFLALAVFMTAGLILSKNAHTECKEGEERMTESRYVFTCDTSHPSLGEAWRDPSGVVWGDMVRRMVRRDDGETVYDMNHSEATTYCTWLQARLPSEKEFTRLREYMGARSGTEEGYSHHDDKILPNLAGHWFWSSSVYTTVPGFAYTFNGSYGSIGIYDFNRSGNNMVRCVVDGR